MGQKPGRFYRIKYKEQGREKQKVNREQENKSRAQSWRGVWGLAGWIYWSSRVFTGTQKLSKTWFADAAPWAQQLHLGPGNLSQCLCTRSSGFHISLGARKVGSWYSSHTTFCLKYYAGRQAGRKEENSQLTAISLLLPVLSLPAPHFHAPLSSSNSPGLHSWALRPSARQPSCLQGE